jgi:hypothetical protein
MTYTAQTRSEFMQESVPGHRMHLGQLSNGNIRQACLGSLLLPLK